MVIILFSMFLIVGQLKSAQVQEMHRVNHMECSSHMLWMIIQKSRHGKALLYGTINVSSLHCLQNWCYILIQWCLQIYMEPKPVSDYKTEFGRWKMAFSPQTKFQEYKFYWRNKKWSFTESAGVRKKIYFTDVITTHAPIIHVINIFLLDLAHWHVKNSFGKCSFFHLNWL